jgi:hypothetical protein
VAQDDLDKSEPARLADALSIHPGKPETLSAQDLGAILQHQLATPFESDLPQTLGELLTGDSLPPLDLLNRAKSFAKFCKSTPDGPLPAPVATVLYFALIAKAAIAHDQRISALSDVELADGFRWSLQQPWVTHGLRELLEKGLVNLPR